MRRPDFEAFARWERAYARETPVDYALNVRVYESMYEHAQSLGVLRPEDLRHGLDDKIRLARRLNVPADPHPDGRSAR